MSGPELGPWEATETRGYSSTYWTLERVNPAWVGGHETMNTKNAESRKWRSRAAAEKAAVTANKKAPS